MDNKTLKRNLFFSRWKWIWKVSQEYTCQHIDNNHRIKKLRCEEKILRGVTHVNGSDNKNEVMHKTPYNLLASCPYTIIAHKLVILS